MNTASVRELEAYLAREAGEIRHELERLSQSLDRLSGAWSGEASEAYRRAQVEWLRTTDELAMVLRASSTAAGNTVERQLAARARVAALWRK